MKTHVWVTAAAVILLGLTTGCERTTPGTVAMTTEPGPPTTTSTRTPSTAMPDFPIPGLPGIPIPGLPTSDPDLPEVPAPPNASTMKCSEYNDLDEATQLAVIRAILAAETSPFGSGQEMVAQVMADAMCPFVPDMTVNEVLSGG